MNKKRVKDFIKQLNAVRKNPDLLKNYALDTSKPDFNQRKRLELNIALYNDWQADDYAIASFLFDEEVKWRKLPDYYNFDESDVDNLYFSAWVLVQFQRMENVGKFFTAKNIDFDSGCGFDGNYLLANGVKATADYFSQYPDSKLFKYLPRFDEITQEYEIEEWKNFKAEYFAEYKAE